MLPQMLPGSFQNVCVVASFVDQHVAVLADRFTHPAQLMRGAGLGLYERPDQNQAACLPGCYDEEGEFAAGRFGQEVISPVPKPIEGLEHLLAAACAIEQVVPFAFQRVKPGARGDQAVVVREHWGRGRRQCFGALAVCSVQRAG